jgi:penicillin-binding protein 1C
MNALWQPGKYRRWRFAAIVMLLAMLALSWLDRRYPLPLPHDRQPSVIVTARDGTPLRAFASENGVWRYPVTPEKVSPLYLQALIGYEDRYFWRHPGVNPVALLRAAGQRLRHGHIVSGGSTLSMQVARILEPQPRTPLGKFKQILRALQLEWHLPKRQILTLYLNYAPFGGTVEGVEAASWAYLGKPSSELSHAEAALLAVLPQSPSRLRPDRQSDAARRARDKVLARLASEQIWSERDVRDALIEPVVSRRLHPPMLAPLLAERLRQANPKRSQIRSTIDADLQQLLEERVASYFTHLPPRSSAALLVVDNRTLEARAYIGSSQFGDQDSLGHVDMVRATRSPGSTLKPFLYGLAIDDGLIDSESLLVDAPQSFGDYRPANFEPTFNGPVSAADALRLSLNVPAVDLLDRLGPERFAARLANAGVTLKFPAGGKPNLALILGGTGVSLEQLIGAYVALNRDGLAGSVKYTPSRNVGERRLLSPGAAWIIRDVLQHHAQDGMREDTFDTSNRSRVAWKTGTSYGFRDAWALGSTAQYTVGVWIGRPDGTPMPGQYGAITALPLMFQVINSLPRSAAVADDRIPAEVRSVKICWPLGLPPGSRCLDLERQRAADVRRARRTILERRSSGCASRPPQRRAAVGALPASALRTRFGDRALAEFGLPVVVAGGTACRRDTGACGRLRNRCVGGGGKPAHRRPGRRQRHRPRAEQSATAANPPARPRHQRTRALAGQWRAGRRERRLAGLRACLCDARRSAHHRARRHRRLGGTELARVELTPVSRAALTMPDSENDFGRPP